MYVNSKHERFLFSTVIKLQRRIVTYSESDMLDWSKISIILVPAVGLLKFHWFIPDASLDFISFFFFF